MSEAASIALHGAIIVARSDEPVNVNAIAGITGTSRHHVAKVMMRLVKKNFFRSIRGPRGGFVMNMPPERITFLDLFEAIEGEIEVNKCPLNRPVCAFEKCILNNITSRMSRDFRDYLREQTLDRYVPESSIKISTKTPIKTSAKE